MQVVEVVEALALILPLVILVEAAAILFVWPRYGSGNGRGAAIATWLGLVALTLWCGWAVAFVLLHVLLFTLGSWAAIAGAIATWTALLLMPLLWAVVVRRQGRSDPSGSRS